MKNPMINNQPATNPMAMLQQLRQNPIAFLRSRGMNVPENIAGNPNAIIQHLMNSGQVSQSQYDRARQMVSGFMNRR